MYFINLDLTFWIDEIVVELVQLIPSAKNTLEGIYQMLKKSNPHPLNITFVVFHNIHGLIGSDLTTRSNRLCFFIGMGHIATSTVPFR